MVSELDSVGNRREIGCIFIHHKGAKVVHVSKYIDTKTLITVVAASYVVAIAFAYFPNISPAAVAAKLKGA